MGYWKRTTIVCPGGVRAGGIEALHQLSDMLLAQNETASLCYVNGVFTRTNPAYDHYLAELTDHIIDEPECLVVLPEIYPGLIPTIKHATVAVWWLGTYDHGMPWMNKSMLHFAQSAYAARLLWQNHHVLARMLSDYIAAEHFRPTYERQRIHPTVLYNPARSSARLARLRSLKHEWHFTPLISMYPFEIVNWMCDAPVYATFGCHPGKDRMPREAALHGCCIVASDVGAANPVDMPIPPRYKIADGEPDILAIERIQDCIDNYEERKHDFDSYREHIRAQKDVFANEVGEIWRGQSYPTALNQQ